MDDGFEPIAVLLLALYGLIRLAMDLYALFAG